MSRRREIRSDGSFDLGFGAGINERDNFNIDISECAEGENFILDPVGTLLRRRPVQDLVATTPNAGEITGIMQMIDRSDTQTQLVVDDAIVYSWNGAAIFSDVTPPLFTAGRIRADHWSLDDILVMTDIDQGNPLFKWDGTDVTRLKTTLLGGDSKSVTNLTCTGSTATATVTAHGYSTGDLVTIAGANETEYNGEVQITVTDANTFTYTMTCSTSPATGVITAEKGVDLRAKYVVVHNNRVWLFNVIADGTAFPSMALASAFEDAEDYDNVNRSGGGGVVANDAFYILAPDLKPINGAVSFFDKLVISTVNGRLFVLNGADATDYEFKEYYPGSSALGEESMVNMGNDLVFFRNGKVVESLVATDKFGDVSADDLSWWIPDLAAEMSTPIAVYDQGKQLVYFFDSSLGGVLVLDKNFMASVKFTTLRLSPWTKWTTLMDNGFSTKAATQIRPVGDMKTTVYWGDDSGNIYDINGTGLLGDGGSFVINTSRKSRVITEMNTTDELMVGRLEYRRNLSAVVDLVFAWLDELHQETVSFTLKAPLDFSTACFFNGSFYWNDTTKPCYWGAGNVVSDQEQVSTLGFSVPGKSTGFVVTIQAADVDEFIISRVYV